MFNTYLIKSLPAKYVFAGYNVRKSLTIMTSQVNGKTIYDEFLFTYIDNYVSFYILMENGKYKSVDYNVEVPEFNAEQLISEHIARGKKVELEESYDRDKVIGVFGLRDLQTLMKQTDELNLKNAAEDIKLSGIIDVKDAYMGMEIMGAISAFNRALGHEKGYLTVPPIKNGVDDPYESVIGDEMDFFDFMSNKDTDDIMRDLKLLSDNIDGVGNVKEGKQIIISRDEDEEVSIVTVKDI